VTVATNTTENIAASRLNLVEFRKAAAQASGGTSGEPIRSMILRLIESEGLAGSLLDFGAGRGDLLQLLHARGGFASLTGVDIFSRPSEFPGAIDWIEQDLNQPLVIARQFDVVVCSEVIEHLENPRLTLRSIHEALKPAGVLLLTMPNQESLRSLAALLIRGHFVSFLDSCYPAHITALLRTDLSRICRECHFESPTFAFSNHGLVPRLTSTTWQRLSLGALTGRWFSDNLAMVTRRVLE
jgi:2-polyprenyl-3-methyl-5-hydroxy-6-metoxy-1,4-benzoquinol methylase